MSIDDQVRWDKRYAEAAADSTTTPSPRCPELFEPYQHLLPVQGSALDIACGTGSGSLWLAERGRETAMTVTGFDVSLVAIAVATTAAVNHRLSDQCRFQVVDLDDGLPPGPSFDLVVCHRYRQPDLYQTMLDRLTPGGTLAVAVLSQVDAEHGKFRAKPGELASAFSPLETRVSIERDGHAIFIGTKRKTLLV